MDKTNIMVHFDIFSDEIPISYISKVIGLIPDKTHLKGDPTVYGRNYYKETLWSIETEYEESYDINTQLDKILLRLANKEKELLEVKQNYNIEIQFMIVIIVENDEMPGMNLRKHFIKFLSTIDAEVAFDIYF